MSFRLVYMQSYVFLQIFTNFAIDMSQNKLSITDYDYALPAERIAQHPLAQRDACKLLRRTHDGDISEHTFRELPTLLPSDAMLVYNNTRVINARLRLRKPTGAAIEVFCLEPHTPADYAENFASEGRCSWTCLVGNSKRWKDGPLELTVDIVGRSVTVSATRVL